MDNMRIEWKDTYSLGIPEIDADHKRIFEILEEMESSSIVEQTKNFFEILSRLNTYATEHFSREEAMIEKIGFSDKNHLLEHMLFRMKLIQLKDKSNSIILIQNTIIFLKDWLIIHVLGTDKLFADAWHAKKRANKS